MAQSHSAPAAEYVVIRDIAVSWTDYLDTVPALAPLPHHLLLHMAGPTPEGVRIVELWDSRTAAQIAERQGLTELERRAVARSGVVRTLEISHMLKAATPSTKEDNDHEDPADPAGLRFSTCLNGCSDLRCDGSITQPEGRTS